MATVASVLFLITVEQVICRNFYQSHYLSMDMVSYWVLMKV